MIEKRKDIYELRPFGRQRLLTAINMYKSSKHVRFNFLKTIFGVATIFLFLGTTEGLFSQSIVGNVSQLPQIEQVNDPYQSRFFRVGEAPKITVYTTYGDINVVHNPNINGVQVDLYVKREFSLWSGSRSLDNYRIIIQQNGNEVIASVEDKRSGRRSRIEHDVQFSFVVQVPKRGSMNLRTIKGEIEMDGVDGQHFIQNHDGNLYVKNSEGEIRVSSTSGDIDLFELKGNVFAKNVSGSIFSRSNAGEIRLSTVSGHVETSDLTGVLVAATVSGDISAQMQEVSRGIYLESVSGDIDLVLPKYRGYSIKASALRYDFEGLSSSESVKRTQSQFSTIEVREGGIPVNLSSVSGTIRIRESQ